MNTYYVQFAIKNIDPDFLDSYFAEVEKELKKIGTVDIKHSFKASGKIYINTYVKEHSTQMAEKADINVITGVAVAALNYEDEKGIKIEVEKVELVK